MVDNPEIVVKAWLLDEIDDKLIAYEKELDSPKTPAIITPGWILRRLPHMNRFNLKYWVRKGFIPPNLIDEKHNHIVFTHAGASLAGHIWYFQEKGAPLSKAASRANRFVRGERPF